MRFTWQFDPARQTLSAPSGWTITVKEIATQLQDRVYHRHDLTGPWSGWKVRGRTLIGPGGVRVTPEALREMAKAWQDP